MILYCAAGKKVVGWLRAVQSTCASLHKSISARMLIFSLESPTADVGRGSADWPPWMLFLPVSEVLDVDKRMRLEAGELMTMSERHLECSLMTQARCDLKAVFTPSRFGRSEFGLAVCRFKPCC